MSRRARITAQTGVLAERTKRLLQLAQSPAKLEHKVRAKLSRALHSAAELVSAPVIADDDLLKKSMRSSTKMNYGCGYDKRADMLNVDMDPACQPDVLINMQALKLFPAAHYETILAKDVLEHIPRDQTLQALLRMAYWMRMQGTIEVQTTSVLGVAQRLQKYRAFSEQLGMIQCLFGTQTHAGDFHYTGFTEDTLSTYLLAAGLSPGTFDLVDEWMFKVQATKTVDWFAPVAEVADGGAEAIPQILRAGLGREPAPHEVAHFTHRFNQLGQDTLEVAIEIFASHERLLKFAPVAQ